MPYFPPISAPAPYHCPGCGGWFLVNAQGISCCVLHAPGTCCHEYEQAVPSPDEHKPVLDCNGDEVPLGIYAVSQIVEQEPQPGETHVTYKPTGKAEYYIDRVRVTQAEYDRAIEEHLRGRGR